MFITPEAFRSLFALALFLFGLLFISAGFWKLIAFGLTGHAKTLATQSARIGQQKALGEDLTRLMEAAIQLNQSVQTLITTSAGVGFLLIVIGGVMLASSYAVVFVV
ncbi:MAG: hypothetical protein AAB217_19250 [Chloroflexota bacterium]